MRYILCPLFVIILSAKLYGIPARIAAGNSDGQVGRSAAGNRPTARRMGQRPIGETIIIKKWWNYDYDKLTEIGKQWLFYASKSNVFDEICQKYNQFEEQCQKLKNENKTFLNF